MLSNKLKKHLISSAIALSIGLSSASIHINVYANSNINQLPQNIEIVIKDNNITKNKVNIQASAEKKIEKDFVTVNLNYITQGNNRNAVQEEVINALNKAVDSAKKIINNNSDVKIITNNVNIYPVYDTKKNIISKWNGNASLTIEGKNIPLISQAASNVSNMTISNIQMKLSDDLAKIHKDDLIKQAIDNFQKEALLMTQNFGFKSFDIAEVHVDFNYEQLYSHPQQFNLMKSSISSSENNNNPEIDFSPSSTKLSARVFGSIYMNK